MDYHQKRQAALRMLRNTLIEVAKQDDTISIKKLIPEICDVWDVSAKTANAYIQELIDMGIARRNEDMLWHNKERTIRKQYLTDERIKQDSAENAKITT